MLIRAMGRGDESSAPAWFTGIGLLVSLAAIFIEVVMTPATADGHRALQWIIGRPKGRWFWIDKTDFRSKRTMSYLLVLLALSDTGAKENLPVITIQAN